MENNEPNSHADYKTQMANYKSLAGSLHKHGFNTALAPVKNGWLMEVTNPNGKTVTIHPRDLLEASRILFVIDGVANAR